MVSRKEQERPTKAGWRVSKWCSDTGISRSYAYRLMSNRAIAYVKCGAMTIIVTRPEDFLASLGAER